jgi:SsrA-binding protein
MAEAPKEKTLADNRRALFDYHIEERFEAGIVLKGSEVKSCRDGKIQLVDSYASIERGELWLHKAHISEWKQGGPHFNHLAVHSRKLLLHKREIDKLRAQLETTGRTLIPLKFYLSKGRIKVELGLARGKNKGDKRETQKAKDLKREMDRGGVGRDSSGARPAARRRSNSSSSYDDE